ncbi:hypothetical protein ACSW8S_18295 (plasmid) [Clostridium perfringens]
MGFSLEWLLKMKQNELSTLEMELIDMNSKIHSQLKLIEDNKVFLDKLKENLQSSLYIWQINSTLRSIESGKKRHVELDSELVYLKKEQQMILSKYNSKNCEIKVLEKLKHNYIEQEKIKKSKKEEAELNELALLVKINE